MTVSTQLLIASTPYLLLFIWYAIKAARFRRLASAAVGWSMLGWVYGMFRDAHQLSRVEASVIVVIAGAMGWLAFFIVFHVEKQRP